MADGHVDLVFMLDEASAWTTSFSWNTSTGTATGSGADHTTASGTAPLLTGATTATVRMQLTNDPTTAKGSSPSS